MALKSVGASRARAIRPPVTGVKPKAGQDGKENTVRGLGIIVTPKDGFSGIRAPRNRFGISSRSNAQRVNDPANKATDPTGQKLDQLIENGKQRGIIKPSNQIRSHFAANRMLGQRPWERPSGDAKEITAKQLEGGLARTAGARQGHKAVNGLTSGQMQDALNYVNGADNLQEQRQRITKTLQGLLVAGKTPGVENIGGASAHENVDGPTPGQTAEPPGQWLGTVKLCSMRKGINPSSTNIGSGTNKGGVIVVPYTGYRG